LTYDNTGRAINLVVIFSFGILHDTGIYDTSDLGGGPGMFPGQQAVCAELLKISLSIICTNG
jgi:hypothetical protein